MSKTVLISGASSGFGALTARALAAPATASTPGCAMRPGTTRRTPMRRASTPATTG